MILGRGESGRARSILAWSKFLDGDHCAAVPEFCAALSSLVVENPQMLEEAPGDAEGHGVVPYFQADVRSIMIQFSIK